MGQGREAVTVRQAILIALLIGAAFLGGAFINGPGLQWVQSRVLRLLGFNNGGEIAAVDLEANLNDEIGSEHAEPLNQRAAIAPGPIAPIPSLVSENKAATQDASRKATADQPLSKSLKNGLASDQPRQSSFPSATSPRSVTKSSPIARASLDQDVMLARGGSLPQSSPSHSAQPSTALEAPAILDSLAAVLLPGDSSRDAPVSPLTSSSTGSKSTRVVGGDEWALLESRMQTLGVSRFTIEGKPDGPVVFACLVPVAGYQAVTERFEAEGDDVIQAAKAVMRRVVLWRATQTSRYDQNSAPEKSGN
jgi:hypothetical protein